jgi:hypothetical protein
MLPLTIRFFVAPTDIGDGQHTVSDAHDLRHNPVSSRNRVGPHVAPSDIQGDRHIQNTPRADRLMQEPHGRIFHTISVDVP